MAYTNEQFFNKLKNGAKWDVGVSIARGNPLPLDANSVFESIQKANEYVSGVLAYPGQIITVLGVEEATAYVVVSDAAGALSLKKIATIGDGETIDLSEQGVLGLHDFGKVYYKYVPKSGEVAEHYEKVTVNADNPWKAGLVPQVTALGNNRYELGWYEPNPTAVEGLQNSVTGLQTRMTTAEGDIDSLEGRADALEDKFESLGGIFNFIGAFTLDEFAAMKDLVDTYQVGDVILVDGKKEYVYIEKTVDGKKVGHWEPFGDPDGVAALASDVTTLKTAMTTAQGDIAGLQTWKEQSQSAINAVASKADKVTGATNGNFAGLDANGNLIDSGKKAADFDAAGAADAVMGKADDEAATTVRGNRAAITAIKTANSNQDKAIEAIQSQLHGIAATSGAVKTAIEAAADLGQQGIDAAGVEKNRIDTILSGATITTFKEVDAFKAAQKTKDEQQDELITKLRANVGTVADNTNLAALVTTAQARADKGVEDAGKAQGLANNNKDRLDAIDKTLTTQGGNITSLTTRMDTAEGNINTVTTTANKNTAKLNGIDEGSTVISYIEAHVVGDAKTSQAKDVSIHGALKAAAEAQSKADSNAGDIVGIGTQITTINEKFGASYNKDNTIAAAIAKAQTDAEATAAGQLKPVSELATSNSNKLAGIGGTNEPATVVAAIAATKAALDTKDNNFETRITTLEGKINGVTGAMHFVGISSTDPLEDGVTIVNKPDYAPADGDVVIFKDDDNNTIEYIYSAGAWVELGDVSDEAKRLDSLETVVGKTATSGLQGLVAANTASIDTINGQITGITTAIGKAGLDGRLSTVEGAINDAGGILDRLMATEGVANGAAADIAVLKGSGDGSIAAAIAAEATARNTQLATTIANYYTKAEIDAKLTWHQFT